MLLRGVVVLIPITLQGRILVAVEPVDFRKGIDGLAHTCKAIYERDPFSGILFVFRNRRGTALKILCYDGQGFWLCQKRLSSGRFRHWPKSANKIEELVAHELHVLVNGGDPSSAKGAPLWKPLRWPA
jgi:transposase